jgi:galactose mutarotase-like enzyme
MTPLPRRGTGRRSSSPEVGAGSSSASETATAFAQVYAPADDDVIAYEAMTAPTNALVDGGPDLPLLEPGGRYEAAFSIRVIDLVG